jgi:predicted acyltransferase
MYGQPDTPKYKTRCSPGLRSATTEAGENIWHMGMRSVWLTSLGAVFPNFLFHGGTGKISFLTSENGGKTRFHGIFGIFRRILDYLFIYLFIYSTISRGAPDDVLEL